MERKDLQFLPVGINVTGKKIMIIGGGKVALHKATILNRYVDKATVISPVFHEGFSSLPFVCIEKYYAMDDLAGAFLVYICTENEQLNAEIKQECEKRNILASVCDNPVLCDFVSPAIYKNGNITVAVSSNAQDVYQSIDIRNQIQQLAENGTIKLTNDTLQSGK